MRRIVPIVLMGLFIGCRPATPPQATATASAQAQTPEPPPRLVIPDGAATFTQRQRSTQALPGSQERVLLTLDDITRGQVMLSITTSENENVLPARSVRAGETLTFQLDGQAYRLQVQALDNELVGDDEGRLVLHQEDAQAEASPAGLTEAEKIERLIQTVAQMEGATFIRNGEEHSPAEAAEHMRRKWQWQRDKIHSAEDFIRLAATGSSTTDQPYLIRLPDGRKVESGAFLREKLAVLEEAEPVEKESLSGVPLPPRK